MQYLVNQLALLILQHGVEIVIIVGCCFCRGDRYIETNLKCSRTQWYTQVLVEYVIRIVIAT